MKPLTKERTVFNQVLPAEEGEWLDYLFFRARRGTCSAMILHRDKCRAGSTEYSIIQRIIWSIT